MPNTKLILRKAILKEGLKAGRPHVHFATYQLGDSTYRTVSRLNRVQYRKGRNGKPPTPRPRVPGWVLVEPAPNLDSSIHRILTKKSYVTLWHTSLDERDLYAERESFEDLAKIEEIWKHREAMLSTMSPTDPAYYDSFLAELPPPDRRHDDHPALEDAFAILDREGWIPPSQGVVLRSPRGHQSLPDEYWLIVSNTQFNRRYPIPILAYVPLIPLNESGLTIEECLAAKRLVREISGITLVAVEEELDTFDVTQDWFKACPRCFDPDMRPHKWLAKPGEKGCVRCYKASAQWPEKVDEIPSDHLAAVLNRTLNYLRLAPPFSGE